MVFKHLSINGMPIKTQEVPISEIAGGMYGMRYKLTSDADDASAACPHFEYMASKATEIDINCDTLVTTVAFENGATLRFMIAQTEEGLH